MTHEQSDPPFDPRSRLLRSTPQTKNSHSDPRLLRSTQTHEERTKNREQRETIRPHRTHDYRTTIAEPEPEPSSDQNHRRISFIGREKREGREEREKRIENGEGVVRINFFIFFYNSGYSELVLIQAHYSSMPKLLQFESFDGVVFLVF